MLYTLLSLSSPDAVLPFAQSSLSTTQDAAANRRRVPVPFELPIFTYISLISLLVITVIPVVIDIVVPVSLYLALPIPSCASGVAASPARSVLATATPAPLPLPRLPRFPSAPIVSSSSPQYPHVSRIASNASNGILARNPANEPTACAAVPARAHAWSWLLGVVCLNKSKNW